MQTDAERKIVASHLGLWPWAPIRDITLLWEGETAGLVLTLSLPPERVRDLFAALTEPQPVPEREP